LTGSRPWGHGLPSEESETLASLKVWDVIWPRDTLIYPPGWKIWVCVSVENLWFLRVNSQPINEPAVSVPVALHAFLGRDSWFGCGGDLIELPEIEVEDALRAQTHPERRGKVGVIDPDCRPEILVGIQASPRLAPFQIAQIISECG